MRSRVLPCGAINNPLLFMCAIESASIIKAWRRVPGVLVVVTAARFHLSRIVCRLNKTPSDETLNRGPRVRTHARRLHTHIEDPVVHDSSVDYGSTKYSACTTENRQSSEWFSWPS